MTKNAKIPNLVRKTYKQLTDMKASEILKIEFMKEVSKPQSSKVLFPFYI